MTETVERVARALCRYTWEREFAGKNLDAYVDLHWREHLPAAGVVIAAQQDGVRRYSRQDAIMIAGIIWDEIGEEICTKEWSQAAADRIVCALEQDVRK